MEEEDTFRLRTGIVSRFPSPVQGTTRRPTNAYSTHNLTDDEEESSSSSESEEAQVLIFYHTGRDTSLTLSRALTRSSPNLNPEHNVDAFLNTVRLRIRADSFEEYRNAERAATKSANPPTHSLPHLSQALIQSHLALQAKRNVEEMTAVLAMVERLDIQRKGREEEGMKRRERRPSSRPRRTGKKAKRTGRRRKRRTRTENGWKKRRKRRKKRTRPKNKLG
ncbi:hypothetical protein RSOLAG1IB_09746 [Rhizoctonia solani AG-1 IB]|uniref:Uncharacterized protein n=1 Tax=Thanatephorus cucumeris (strain AG1-IB / isolate 7/3/14) TaxID=1108050 RepID=A0A0B7FUQ5_THACB|nr:hypothetical protein RSOLAG1IB_09746 [Rhizoctonia solani AG-1 IB]